MKDLKKITLLNNTRKCICTCLNTKGNALYKYEYHGRVYRNKPFIKVFLKIVPIKNDMFFVETQLNKTSISAKICNTFT